MNWIFIVSNLTDIGVRSSRTANIVRAFARANAIPSAIMAWNIATGECLCAKFDSREELNKFFDKIRKECEVA